MAASVLALLAPSGTGAAQSDAPTLGPTPVEGQAFPAVDDDPTAFATVIDVRQYDGELKDVADLLAQTVGVQVRRFGGEGQRAEVSIRGSSSSQVVITLDGVRLNTAQSDTVDLSTIPLSILDRIEVVRGGGSVGAGSGAIGGVVNLVTRRSGGTRSTDLAFRGGSFDTYAGFARHADALRGVDYLVSYDGYTTEGDWRFKRSELEVGGQTIVPDPDSARRVNNDARRHAGLIALDWEPHPRIQLGLRDYPFYASRGQPGFDAGSAQFAGQRQHAHERDFRNVAGLEAAWRDPLASDSRLSLRLSHLFERARFRDPDVVPAAGSALSSDNRNQRLGAELRHDVAAQWGWLEQRWITTAGFARETLDSDEFEDRRRNQTATALRSDLSAWERRIHFVPGLRWEKTEGFGSEWIPKFGASLEPVRGVRFLANYGKSYRVPNFDELFFPDQGFTRGNPALEPEQAWDGDVGLELWWDGLGPLRDLRFEVAGFHSEIDNAIVWVLVSPSLSEPRNTGSATIRGVELGGSLRGFGWLYLSANYTHLDADRDDTGTPLPGRARNETALRVELGPPRGQWRMSVEMLRTSEIPVSESGNTVLPERTVWDGSVWVDLMRWPILSKRVPLRRLLLSFEARNFTDQAVRDAQFFPQPPRTFYAGVEALF